MAIGYDTRYEAPTERVREDDATEKSGGAGVQDPAPTGAAALGSIFGAGRSGTSWLGSLVASHPDVAFRFEPFHRLQGTPEIDAAHARVLAGSLDAEGLAEVRAALARSHPDSDKPPFFAKRFDTRANRIRQFLWPAVKVAPWLHPLYARLRPSLDDATLVFKEVALVEEMVSLLDGGVPTVYIVRHPCAVVWSLLRGQQDNLMPTARRADLTAILEQRGRPLLEEYGDRIEALTPAEQEAVLWRLDVGRSLAACDASRHAHVVVYEQLVEKPLEVLEGVLARYGLQITPQVEAFVRESTTESTVSHLRRGGLGVKSYFRVHRDSVSARDSWKDDMPDDLREQVLGIVETGEAWQLGASRGLWDRG